MKKLASIAIALFVLGGCVTVGAAEPITSTASKNTWIEDGPFTWSIWISDQQPMKPVPMRKHLSFTAPEVAEPRLAIVRECPDGRREITTIVYHTIEVWQTDCNGKAVRQTIETVATPTLIAELGSVPSAPDAINDSWLWFVYWLEEESST